jgi:type III pantothenate kinase
MNLIIDLGNTQDKYAVFKDDKIIESWKDHITRISAWKRKLKTLPEVKLSILSTVYEGNVLTIIRKSLANKLALIELSAATPVPINNKYQTPETLGNDRLANVVGATVIFPKQNVLVIDMGTCIKYDFIDKKKNYFGGAISPGFEMRFKALKHFTYQLPLIEPSENFSLTGRSTEESILSGVQNGIIFEINGMINEYEKKHDELKVIITGGDHAFFANHLKSSIFAAPNLTLQGLNEILEYNVRKSA